MVDAQPLQEIARLEAARPATDDDYLVVARWERGLG
jgi:hypothetical protein